MKISYFQCTTHTCILTHIDYLVMTVLSKNNFQLFSNLFNSQLCSPRSRVFLFTHAIITFTCPDISRLTNLRSRECGSPNELRVTERRKNRTKNSLSGRVTRSPKSELQTFTCWTGALFPFSLSRNVVCCKRRGLDLRSQSDRITMTMATRSVTFRNYLRVSDSDRRFFTCIRHVGIGKQNDLASNAAVSLSITVRSDVGARAKKCCISKDISSLRE